MGSALIVLVTLSAITTPFMAWWYAQLLIRRVEGLERKALLDHTAINKLRMELEDMKEVIEKKL